MTDRSDDGIELINPALIPFGGLDDYLGEVLRRIVRDLAGGGKVTERRTSEGDKH